MRMSVSTEEVSGPGPVGGGISVLNRSPSLTPPTTMTMSPGGTESDVVKTAYRKKVKGKKKFFVLRRETESGGPARLEYHASERKFKLGHAPKKSIVLKACFNISRTDAKCKWAVALHTHNDCVRIAMNSEEEMNEWLRVMNSLTGDEDESEEMMMTTPTSAANNVANPLNIMGGGVKPHFEHVWLVTALDKGLGSKENIRGPYRLCLTSKELTLLKVGDHEDRNAILKFPLNVIRNVSHDATIGCFFHIEFGRLAPTGPGQLSLKTEDNNIAQNMHLLILKAMQNYSKEDLIPRDGTRRQRTNTWNSFSDSMSRMGSNYQHGTPPVMTRINSMDSSIRHRTESIGSSESRGCGVGMSPPMPIHTPPPSISFSPMCSTTDSASSSYSVDYENNNGQNRLSSSYMESSGFGQYSKSQEDESYVPWNPVGEETSLSMTTTPPNLSLPLSSYDTTDYVETTVGQQRNTDTRSTTTTAGSGSAAATPSSYVEMQSPLSPFENYMSMSPGVGTSAKSGGKVSGSHSRNSSLIEEHDGYVPMNPGSHRSQLSQCGSCTGSTAGSTAGLDDSYMDMDFGRKLNLSNDDVRRASPTSSESLQSGTPSSDYPLDKVSSYLLPSDDLDDSSGPRPLRAYSVGSKSDTSATGKGRYGRNRLEAVQETFRLRALSVGARNPRAKPPIQTLPTSNSNGSGYVQTSAATANSAAPLSSSWSGSTGRWPLKYFSQNHTSPFATHSHQNSNTDTVDSDLMELDFSHNKKGRKRSLPGPGTIGTLSTSSVGSSQSSGSKISPCQKGIAETPETPEAKSSPCGNYMQMNSEVGNLKYPASAPISIQKNNVGKSSAGFPPSSTDSGISILTRMTGLDLKQIKQMDDDGAYLDMNFAAQNSTGTNSLTKSAGKGNGSGRRSSSTNLPIIPRSSSLNGPSVPKPVLPAVVVKASDNVIPATFNLEKIPSFNSPPTTNSDKSANVLNIPATSTSSSTANSPSLSRIEESPEKQDCVTNLSPRTSSPQSPDDNPIPPGLLAVTYAAIEHLPTKRYPDSSSTNLRRDMKSPSIPAEVVTYSQIDFIKSGEAVRTTN